MNKTSNLLIGVGVLVLVAVGYRILDPNPSINHLEQNQVTTQDVVVPTFIEADFVYKKDLPYEAQVVKVEQGKEVILNIVSDLVDEAHLHGYNISTELELNKPEVITFVADKTGRFELELEKIGKPLGYIEVYPK